MCPAAVRGRPRDPRVDEAVVEHLLVLLAERGPTGFTVDELAARSGVSKAAIYRRYRCREDLVEAGFAAINAHMPDVTGLSTREALVELLEWVSGKHAAGMTPTWMLAMQQMPQLHDLYMQRVVQPRRDALQAVLERGRGRGEIRADVDVDAAVTCLSAPAVLIGMHKARATRAGSVSVADTVDLVLDGIRPSARATGS
jgi:AcrR family transcriptional regulator